MSKHQKFSTRILRWRDADIIDAIDVRKLKLVQASRDKNHTMSARLERELVDLKDRLCAVRTKELFPGPEPEGKDSTPPAESGTTGQGDPIKFTKTPPS